MTVTAHEWAGARDRARRVAVLLGLGALASVAALGFPAVYLAGLTASGGARYPVTVGWLALLMAPVVVLLSRRSSVPVEEFTAVLDAPAQTAEPAVPSAPVPRPV